MADTVREQRRALVGIAWLSPQELPRYRLFKIFQTEPGGYAVEPVEDGEPVVVDGRAISREAAAWQWIETACPWPWVGVWYNDHPGLVWARTVQKSQMGPLVIHILRPLSTQPPSFCVAEVRVPPRSDPD